MDRRVTPPKRVTTPTWGPPPPCTQALSSKKTPSRVIIAHGMKRGLIKISLRILPNVKEIHPRYNYL